MKAKGNHIGRLIVGCVLACCLTSKLHAQMPPLPPTDTNSVPTTNTVDWVALEAAQQTQFIAEYGPWYEQDASVLDDPTLVSQAFGGSPGTFLTSDQRFQVRQTLLQNMASASQAELDAELAGALNFAAANNIPTNYVDAVGTEASLVRIEDGQPVYIINHDLNQAKTIAANAVWTNGATGLDLNGEGTFMGMFDGGDVLTNHQEFNGGRVSNFDPTI